MNYPKYYEPTNDLEWLEKNQQFLNRAACSLVFNDSIILKELGSLSLANNYWNNAVKQHKWLMSNGWFDNVDAEILYKWVLTKQPKKIFEVGCGYSTMVITETGLEINRILIEPFPSDELTEHISKNNLKQYLNVELQRVPLVYWTFLKSGDLLFYDGSHVSKPASDVNWMIFKILPLLAPGVTVHFHDIFLPDDYPEEWIFERKQTWNEQYVLSAFLQNNSEWTILLPNHYLGEHSHTRKGGCSFYIRKN